MLHHVQNTAPTIIKEEGIPMFVHKTALLSAITTALLASASVQAAEPLKAVGAGEGQLDIRSVTRSIAMMIRRSIRPAIAIPARTSLALICITWTSAAKCWEACSIPSITCAIIRC